MKHSLSRIIFLVFTLVSSINLVSCPEPTKEIITKGKIYTPGSVKQFKDMLAANDLVVVDFYADWCHPCKLMHEVFDALAQDKDLDNILFIKIDTVAYPALSYEYAIQSLPTTILFVDGSQINRIYGYYSKKSLKKKIQETFFE